MNIQEVVRRYRLEATSTGTDDVIQKTRTMSKSQDELGAASERSTQKLSAYDTAMQRHARSMELYNKQQQQMAAIQAQNAMMVQQNTAALMTANDNYAKSNFSAASAVRSATSAAIEHGSSYLATAGKIGAAVIVFGGLLGILGTVYLAYKILKTGVDLVTDAWDLGNQRIADYVAWGQKASIVTTDFAQRLAKAAPGVDLLTESVKKLNDATAPKLGGSEAQKRIDELTTAGNFKGNSGVDQFKMATDAEAKFRAMASLIDQAMQKGERLAALDLSAKFLGPQVTDALTKDNDYLNQMLRTADRIAKTDLVSPEDIGRATELTARYDAAVKILSDRWHPLQKILTELGVMMKSVWVSIVETIASGVDVVGRFVSKLWNFPYWDKIKDAWSIITTGYKQPEGPAYVDPKTYAVDQLRAGLQTPSAQKRAYDQTQAMSWELRPDTSFNPDKKKQIDDVKDALDRAKDSVEKYVLTTNAAAVSVDAGVAAQEKARVIAQLTAAAQRDGKTDLEQYAKEWDGLGNRAGEAAKKLALAQVQSQIKFDRTTLAMGLSQEDVQIAQQLWKIYDGDIPKALNSTEAAQIRLNNEVRAGKEINSSFANDLVSGLLRGENAMKSMTSAATNLIQKLSSQNLKRFMEGGDFFGKQDLNSTQGAVGMASAGMAGYQSGNPLTGALGGAMAGAAFGPWGAALGGGIGLIGGIIGADDKSRQQLQEAQREWKTMSKDVQPFNAAKPAASKRPDNDNEQEQRRDRDKYLTA